MNNSMEFRGESPMERPNALYSIHNQKTYIALHHRNPNLTVSSLAAEFGLSRPIFSAQFIRHAGVGPLEYLTKLRVQTAMELLKTTEDTLPVVAQQSGFGSVSSMHRIFKKFTGMTPAQARNGLEPYRVIFFAKKPFHNAER